MNAFRRLRDAVSVVAGRSTFVRSHAFFPDDVLLVSYPKSGNTWVRFLVGNLLDSNEPITFANLERRVPDLYVVPERDLLACPRPRHIKSHEAYDARYRRVVYVVRDPRDVLISAYHYSVKTRAITEELGLEAFAARSVAGDFRRQPDWGEHVGSWLGARLGSDQFLLLRYEDLLSDTLGAAERLAAFLGVGRSEDQLRAAVQRSSAAELRRQEEQDPHAWVAMRGTRADRPFVRAARAGQWQGALSEHLLTEIERQWGRVMREAGYPPAERPAR